MSQIVLKNVSVTYVNKKSEVKALDCLNATIDAPMNVIVGSSGCGKTTLLRSILGLVDYDGEILLDGLDIDEIEPKDRNFSFVSQQYVLYPHLTVFENIAFPLKNLRASKGEIISRVNAVAEILDIKACLNKKPKHISGGQQQRAAIARALVKRPSVCFFDEPFSNVDEVTRASTVRWLKSALDKAGCTCVYVTHDLREAFTVADKIYVMDEGEVVECGTPNEVFDSNNEVVKLLISGGLA